MKIQRGFLLHQMFLLYLFIRVLVACPKTGAPRPDYTTLITDHFSNNNHTDLILPQLEITSESFWGYSLFYLCNSGIKKRNINLWINHTTSIGNFRTFERFQNKRNVSLEFWHRWKRQKAKVHRSRIVYLDLRIWNERKYSTSKIDNQMAYEILRLKT